MNTSLAHEVPPEDSDTLSSISKQIVANNWKNIFQQLIEKGSISINVIQEDKNTKVSNINRVIEVLNSYLKSTPFVVTQENNVLILQKRENASPTKNDNETYPGITGEVTAHFQETHFVSYGMENTSISLSLPDFHINGNKEIVKHLLESIISTSENTFLKQSIDFQKQSIDGIAYSLEDFITKVQGLISSILDGESNKNISRINRSDIIAENILGYLQENQGKAIDKEAIRQIIGKQTELYPYLKKVKTLIEKENTDKEESKRVYLENIPFNYYVYGTQEEIKKVKQLFQEHKKPGLVSWNKSRKDKFLENFQSHVGEYISNADLISIAKNVSLRPASIKKIISILNEEIQTTGYSIVKTSQGYIYDTIENNQKRDSQKQENSTRGNRLHIALKLFQENKAAILTPEKIVEHLKIQKNSIPYIIKGVLNLIQESGYTVQNIHGKGYMYGTKAHLALQRATLKPVKIQKALRIKETREKSENIPTRIFKFLIENVGKIYSQENIAENVGCALTSLPVSQAQVKVLLGDYNKTQLKEGDGKLLFENLRGKGWMIGTREQIDIIRREIFGKKSTRTEKIHISQDVYPKLVQRFYPVLRSRKGEVIPKEEIITLLKIKENSLGYILKIMKEIIEKENQNIKDNSQKRYLENIRGIGYIYGTRAEIENLERNTISGTERVRTPSKAQQLLNILLENRGKIYLANTLVNLVGVKRDDFSALLAGLKKKITEYNTVHGLKGAQEIEVYKTDRGAYVVGNYTETRNASNGLYTPVSTPLPIVNQDAPKIEYSIEGLSFNVDIDVSKFNNSYDTERATFLGRPITQDQIALIYLIASSRKVNPKELHTYINTGEKNNKTTFLLTLKAQINNIFQGVFQILVKDDIWYIETSDKHPKKHKTKRKPKAIKEKKERVTNATQLRDFFLQNPGTKLRREKLIREIGMGETSFNVVLSKARKLIENTGRIVSIHGGYYMYKPTHETSTHSAPAGERRVAVSNISPRTKNLGTPKSPVHSLSNRESSIPSSNSNQENDVQLREYTGELSSVPHIEKIISENTDIEINTDSQSINGIPLVGKNEFVFFMKLLEQRGHEFIPSDFGEDIDMEQLFLMKAHINNVLKSENGYIHIQKGKKGFFILKSDIKSENNYSIREDIFSIGKDNLYIKFNGKMIPGFSSEQIEILRTILKKKQRGIPYVSFYRAKYESMKSIFERLNIGYRISISATAKLGIRLLHATEEVVGGEIQTKAHLTIVPRIEGPQENPELDFSDIILANKGDHYEKINTCGIVHQYNSKDKFGETVIDESEIILDLPESTFIIFLLITAKKGEQLRYDEFSRLLDITAEGSNIRKVKKYLSTVVDEINNSLKKNNTNLLIRSSKDGLIIEKVEKANPIQEISFGEKGELGIDENNDIIWWNKVKIDTVPARTIEIILRLIKRYQKDGSTTINLSRMVKSGKNPELFFNPILSFLREKNLPFTLTNNGILRLKDGYLPR